ncbi:MAG: AMP-binding protein [Rhodospirillales bacterium]|nr:AMP-binding protein [Rhodospirillales bacterium]
MLAGCTPWPEEFAARYRQKGYWLGITLPEMVERTAARFPDKTALVYGDRRLTYTELVRAVDSLACGFVQHGLKPLDRVVLHLPNSADFVIVFLGLIKAGVIPVMALPAHRHGEIGHFIAHAQAVAYLIPDRTKDFDYRAMAAELAPASPSLRKVFVLGEPGAGQIDLRAMLAAKVEAAQAATILAPLRPPASEVALMLLSGGTTGMPKLIPRTHDDYVYNCRASAAAYNLDDKTVYLAVLLLAHNYTLIAPGFLGMMAVGGTTVIASNMTAEHAFALIERERVTMAALVPPLAMAWLAACDANRHNLSSLQFATCGAARLSPEMRAEFEARIGCTYIEEFGTGEGFLCQTPRNAALEVRMNGSGKPISEADEVRIVDENDHDVAEGERGEILARGPYTIRGYYNAPAINASSFTADGFYRMGDMARLKDGTIYVEGRKKDLINRGGEKISSEEVEDLVRTHPAIANVCVVAMPDDYYGEKACAFVILKPGERLAFSDLVAFMESTRIARFKFPERLEVVESFPMSPVGKILRHELRKTIAARLAEEKATTVGR